MKLPLDAQFRNEEAEFHLVRSCEDCTLYDERTDACAHGYPTSEHKRAASQAPGAELVFCKDFEAA